MNGRATVSQEILFTNMIRVIGINAINDTSRTIDPVAERIVNDAADELVCAARSVIEQLEFTAPFDVVLSGGNFIHQPMFVAKLRDRLVEIRPEASLLLPRHEPAYGAVLLAQTQL